jgi:PAS domain S-box-containing protein
MLHLLKSRLAIVGCGKFCLSFLQFLKSSDFSGNGPQILGVADKNQQAMGIAYAKSIGIPITDDYTEFYSLSNLEVILELTNDPTLAQRIKQDKPSHVRLIDHFEARSIWDSLQVEEVKKKCIKKAYESRHDPDSLVRLFEELAERFSSIIQQRNNRSREIELELFEQERTMAQIIEGSTIPTFVINKDHIVTHWNKALEKLVGVSAEEMVGANLQWKPFWSKKRPTMADVILDRIDEQGIKQLYGTTWQKSALIEGAYQAEVFFPNLGENGKWCFFTAAPIKTPDGKIIGAVETLWDKTDEKKAEEDREQHTRELSTLCSIYTALNAPSDVNDRIHSAIHEVSNFLEADGVCIFLMEPDGKFHSKYSIGLFEDMCDNAVSFSQESIVYKVAMTGAFTIFEDLPQDCLAEACFMVSPSIRSLAYIPISTKERSPLGVILIAGMYPRQFSDQKKNILELIGNRIGVAIENAMLQEQYIKSEEKYRSLFNNDPNPIFIIDSSTFQILDINQRAKDCYGYTREELFGFPFLNLGDEDDEEVSLGLKNLSRQHSLLFSKKRHYKKNSKPFYVNINVSYAKYGESDVLIATTTDITESVEKETQLIQASKMTTLGVMAAGMAHEINQPLNVIQVCADYFLKMLKRGEPIREEDLKTMANDIVENVERATNVIKHVRDFARQSDAVRSRVNINDPIQDVFKVLGHQLKIHRVELTLDLASDLPFIMAEHNRLEQVFINLVTNAIDAMDEKVSRPAYKDSEKKLTIRSFKGNGHVVVDVTDTGIGMTEEVKNKIFEPFFTTKKTGKGTGLGVSISYGIVKDYEGTILIESEFGQGTTFRLRFPSIS